MHSRDSPVAGRILAGRPTQLRTRHRFFVSSCAISRGCISISGCRFRRFAPEFGVDLELADGIRHGDQSNFMRLRITWRDAKAAKNWRDHRVAFTEAETVFYSDPNMQTIFNPEHSDEEKRYTLSDIHAAKDF
jgi:hypothetical protein